MERQVVGKLVLIIYVSGSDADGWLLTTNTGMQSHRYLNKWLAMQDYLRGTINWEREHVRDVPNGGGSSDGISAASPETQAIN